MNAEDYANEARRLLADMTFRSALSTVHYNALEALATVDADDKTAVLRLQQKAAVIEEVLSELEGAILAMSKPEDNPVP
jgi:hypothetical protein